MTATPSIPMPPPDLRDWIGPTDIPEFDNPSGTPIYAELGLPLKAYETVFDFGCGCGRIARQLLQQTPRPQRYVGIDVHPRLSGWCRENLSPVDPHFEFLHHDVYSPNYAPGNSLRLTQAFPVPNTTFSLVIAHSVFTHLTKSQTEYYLSEIARILAPDGVALTTWLFFDRASFPFLPELYCLYTSEADFALAVIYDREWFLATVRNLGLGVLMTRRPAVAGHQWTVCLVRRTPDMVDQFPLGSDQAEWVCGATLKPIATVTLSPGELAKVGKPPVLRVGQKKPAPPPLFGVLEELDSLKRSWAWRIGHALTSPMRILRRWMRLVRP
jgi:SAM-dependent methyltransferase